jgi:hypothetical protein
LFVQFQFVSFFKIKNTLLINNIKNPNIKYTQNDTNPKTILTTNVHIFYIILFLIKFEKFNELSTNKTPKNNFKKLSNLKLSFFFLPITKKNVIFLRAPYKNKLARLNILQLSYKFFFSIKSTNNKLRPGFCNNSDETIKFFKDINLSSFKIKHTETTIKFYTTNKSNFHLNNFN